MTVSIIIAVKTWQKNLEECVVKCGQLDFKDYEIIILPDESFVLPFVMVNVKIIPTGNTNPAKKRDIGLKHAKGEILAFLDDDAYPAKDWLKNAVLDFSDPNVAAVGGPAVTPDSDSYPKKASGLVYSSLAVSGKYVYRYIPVKKKFFVDDYPSCNFLVRKEIMEELGGFDTDFWPGEDTKLCLDITQRLGKKILYDPGALVYHHRRPLFTAHLHQILSYATHRGYFVKRYPGNSLRLAYFIPSLFVVFLIFGSAVSLFSHQFLFIYLIPVLVYLHIVAVFSILASRRLNLILMVFLGIISTHICYGIYFIKGLFSSSLREAK
ncbi:MAG: glycosyltransferase [Candidatus Omnitrophica bacterium]|jgi:cellulose synthase/poly-beta-1,6-N-acetylglucosamine synthase-like glycosyltransferase|nr:glycosyltransferase [Candidatus Omnitrophota bacterium]